MHIGCISCFPRSGSLAKERHGWWKPQKSWLELHEALQMLNASDASDVTFQSEPRLSSDTFLTRLDRHCIGLRRVTKAWTCLDLQGAKAGTAKLQPSKLLEPFFFLNVSRFDFFCWDRVLGVAPGNSHPFASSNGTALEIRSVSIHVPADLQQSPVHSGRLCGTFKLPLRPCKTQ